MPFPLLIPLIASAASAIGGALANRKKTTTSTQQQDTTNTTNAYTQPEYTPQMQALLEQIWRSMSDRTTSPFESTGYVTGGLQDINKGADSGLTLLKQKLAAMGMGGLDREFHFSRINGNRVISHNWPISLLSFRSVLNLLLRLQENRPELVRKLCLEVLGRADYRVGHPYLDICTARAHLVVVVVVGGA